MTLPAAYVSSGAVTAPELSAEQVNAYARTGWVAARGFFSAAEAAEIGRWTDEVTALPEVPGRHMVYWEPSLFDPAQKVRQRIEDFTPYHAGFDGLVNHGRLIRAIETLLDAPAVLFKEKINYKMPGGAGFEPHQDQQAGWGVFASLFLTALVGVDAATLDNGCLEMADTARLTRLIGEEWTPLTPAEMAAFRLIPLPTEPGDVLFFDSYAPHGSAPNLTDAARRILYLTYNRAGDGDHRARYFAEKRAAFPPDVERKPGAHYKFRV